jgi:hypothetical protein
MTDRAEWDEWITEALEITETTEDKQRRLHHLERDILTADLPPKDAVELVGRLHAVLHTESTHD